MTLDSLPDLEYKRVVSCKDSFHGTDVLAVSEHGAPGWRPNIHTTSSVAKGRTASIHCRPAPPRETEPFPAPENVAAKRCASEKRAF